MRRTLTDFTIDFSLHQSRFGMVGSEEAAGRLLGLSLGAGHAQRSRAELRVSCEKNGNRTPARHDDTGVSADRGHSTQYSGQLTQIPKVNGKAACVGQRFLSASWGRLPRRPEAGLESPANRQAGKPAPHLIGLAQNRRPSTWELRISVLRERAGKE